MAVQIVVEINEEIRIDKFLANNTDFSRSLIGKMIDDKRIFLNGKSVKCSSKVSLNDIIELQDDYVKNEDIEPNEMKIDIVREALQCLTSREQQIILLRYGLDEVHKKTQDEVAEIFGCSKTTIAKQEQKALVKMRHPRNTRKLKDFIED